MELPDISISINSEKSLKNGIIEILSLIRPAWAPRSTIKFKTFSGGLTNKLVGAYINGKKEEMILVRIYGQNSDLMIDRKKEIENMKTS